jgi:hypothetical protein
VNGTRLDGPRALRDGDLVVMGSWSARFRDDTVDESATAAS